MAATRLTAIHTGKGRGVAKALKDSIDYMENPFKTDDGELISTYECDARTADAEFLLAKQRYFTLTGRDQGKSDVIAYHVRQSFKPGEITPAEANAIGYELAARFTKGKYAFLVCTHTDKSHIHNHIIWNSTALDCRRKFRNFFFSAFALRRCSDILCAENGLSVIENPKAGRGQNYGAYVFGDNKPPTFQDRLRRSIDAALEKSPATFEEFLALMRASGVTVLDGRKHLRFLAAHEDGLPDQEKPTRCDTLRGDYTVAAIKDALASSSRSERPARERLAGRIVSSPAGKAPEAFRPSLLIDIEAKIRQGKGPGFEHWAKLHNLKQMAHTLIYLQENGLDDYNVLKQKALDAAARFNGLSGRIKELETTLASNAALQKHIVNYSKTRAVYVEYRKAGYSKKFRALHEADILLHQAAKKAFDELGLKKLPTVASLRAEYAPTLEEKKQAYREYQRAKDEMRELLTAKSHVDRLMGYDERRTERGVEIDGR